MYICLTEAEADAAGDKHENEICFTLLVETEMDVTFTASTN